MHEGEEFDYSTLVEIFGMDSFLLKSVGITVGSSTSHLIFSELIVRRSDSRINKYEVSERKEIYRSPILFTPYIEGVEVDSGKLYSFLMRVYKEAGITPEDVDTGAVIITGYAARKENAETIVNLFSRWAGKFVCATAGPNLESIMSAYGSGAVAQSKETGKTIINVDIGGGTSKIAIVKEGTIIETTSICVGSRVIAMDNSNRVIRIEEAADIAAKELGIELKLNSHISAEELSAITDRLLNSLFELIERKPVSSFTQELMEGIPIQYQGDIDIIMFSGGVAEYIYGYEETDYNDLGPYLGKKIKQHLYGSVFHSMLREPVERIRATVMGVAQYSLQVSGSTVFLSRDNIVPMRNLRVIKVKIQGKSPNSEWIDNAVRKALSKHDMDDNFLHDNPIALAVDFSKEIVLDYNLLKAFSQGVVSGWNTVLCNNDPLVLIFNLDIAKLIGSVLTEDIDYLGDLICLDGVEVGDMDFVDIGTAIGYSKNIPIVVKNIVF